MHHVSVESILALVLKDLTEKEQIELLERLQTYLTNQDQLASQIEMVLSKAQSLLFQIKEN